MSRLQELRGMRDFIDREIQVEAMARSADALDAVRANPLVTRVCELYGTLLEEVLLGVRRHDVTRTRHAITWLLHRDGVSIERLVYPLGYGHRSSVCRALRRVEGDLAMRALLLGLEAA